MINNIRYGASLGEKQAVYPTVGELGIKFHPLKQVSHLAIDRLLDCLIVARVDLIGISTLSTLAVISPL